MLCPNCKKEIENGSKFCEHCGVRVKKSKKWLWITLSVILMSVIATIVIITIQEQKAMEQNRVEQSKLELEQQLQAERIAKEEAERQAELASQEAARNAELVRQEAVRKAEAERQAELARQEAARKAEAERQAEIARQREARRQELLSQGLVDLGLPSGTLWKNANEGGDYTRYTYDEAVRKFGNKLPTKQQLEELINECEWTCTGSDYKVIGPNGESITLPAAGYCGCFGGVYHVGTKGYYWSSTPGDSGYAWYLYCYSSEVNMGNGDRCSGLSVRLVQ